MTMIAGALDRSRLRGVRSLLVVVAALPSALAGCATIGTMERLSPSEPHSDMVMEVTAAHRQPSGAIVVCVVGEPAHAGPSLFTPDYTTAFSLILPPDAPVRVSPGAHRHAPQFQVTAANVGGACPENADPATPLAVRRIDSSELGNPDFSMVRYDALEPLLVGPGTEGAALWVIDSRWAGSAPRKKIVYVDALPRFEGARAVEIATGPREVKGQPAYALLLPFAIVFDVLMSPLYLLAALASGH